MDLHSTIIKFIAVSITFVGSYTLGFADDTKIHADNCGIAAGRDANNNVVTCNYGLSPKQLKELTHATVKGATGLLLDRIETLSKRLGVTEEAARMMLRVVGEQSNLSDEDLAKALTEVAIEYKNLKAQTASIDLENPLARALVTEIQNQITAGHLKKAGYLIQKITKHTATLSGTCTKVEAMGVPINPKSCLPQVLNSDYHDGRIAFTFVIHQKGGFSVISFSGYGPDQIHITSDKVMQPINKVVFTFQGSSDNLKADGTCHFTNPYKGTPSTIFCKVRTSQGAFSGEFISNGVSPDIFEADAGGSIRNSLPEVEQSQFLQGRCKPSSHIADGNFDEDLTKKQSQFFCDSAVIIPFSDDPKHRLIHFLDSQSHFSRTLAFGGLMKDESIMIVHNAYLETGRLSTPSNGMCKLFFKKQAISAINCETKIDKENRRTVSVVSFVVDDTNELVQKNNRVTHGAAKNKDSQ